MSGSKSVGIILLLALGLTIAFNSSAATNVPVIKKSSKKVAKKTSVKPKKAIQKVARASSISNSDTSLKTQIESIKAPSEKAKSWSVETFADYMPETSKSFDSGITYGLDFLYRPSGYHVFAVVQRANQILLPSDTTEKFKLANTKLLYNYRLTDTEIKEHSVSMRFLVTLGNSEQARLDGLNSVQSARLEFHKMHGSFMYGLRPYLAYYWYDYGTNAKGEPVPLFGLGHNLLLAYSFNDKWSLATEINTAFAFLQPEEIKRAKSLAEAQGQDASKVVDSTTSSFSAGIELGYQATKAFGVHLGYAQEDKLMTEGRYAMDLLDKKSTRAYVGLGYSF